MTKKQNFQTYHYIRDWAMSSKPSQCLLVGTVLTCPHHHLLETGVKALLRPGWWRSLGLPPLPQDISQKTGWTKNNEFCGQNWIKLAPFGTSVPVRFCLRSHDLPEGQADAVSMEELIPDHGEPLEMRVQKTIGDEEFWWFTHSIYPKVYICQSIYINLYRFIYIYPIVHSQYISPIKSH